jgi:hypothetical protein
MLRWMRQAIALAGIICVASQISFAQSRTSLDPIAQAQTGSAPRAPTAAASGEASVVAKANEWTLGLAGGHCRAHQPQHHQREVLCRPELESQLSERRGKCGKHQCADASGEQRRHRRHRKGGSSPALTRHLISVDAGDDRGNLPGDIDQYRRG